MKQILQNLADGETLLADVPAPKTLPGSLLISTRRSLVSAGTERMLLAFGKASLVNKARQQPDKVRMVLDKVRSDGLTATLESVRARLDQPVPLGYSNAGVVVEVGDGVSGFRPGDRVVSNGAHAEFVCVPQNLCAKVPPDVNDEQACFAVVGAIALQGIRLVQPTLGEHVAVIGLGLVGLLTVQLLRAHGCRVLGLDIDAEKCSRAEALGARTAVLSEHEDPVRLAESFSGGRGMDAVIIAAAANDDGPLRQAAEICRKRARIVLVGVVGMRLSRDLFFRKELTFQVSCSYGPGRYDPLYEEHGHDYPIAYVRWTAQRNFEAVLAMLSDALLNVEPLISHRFDVSQAARAYAVLEKESPLAIVLEYGPDSSIAAIGEAARKDTSPEHVLTLAAGAETEKRRGGAIGVLGAGNYASRVLIPAFRDTGATLRTLVANTGVNAAVVGRRFGFAETATDASRVMTEPAIGSIVVATRHDSHAQYVCDALSAGKNVFVEKPLAINHAELDSIESAYGSESASSALLMVGFNRRFAPLAVEMKTLVDTIAEPLVMVITVNAGDIPTDHWVHDPMVGGGRIVGEACHFIDFARFLAGCPVATWKAARAGSSSDRAAVILAFENGSLATIHYVSGGHRAFPKERVEVFAGGRVLQLDNYRKLRGWGWQNFSKRGLWRQDKGNAACVAAFMQAVREERAAPIAFAEIMEVSRLSIDVASQLT